ncbi:MAG: hypothetical protein ACYS4W_10005 [Planctomycetota bacterium]|jgi:hypothetical protein
MDVGMYELVERILYGVSFIAIGGTLALIFFFVFAPSILGSRTIRKQLERLEEQTEQMNKQLRQIGQQLEDGKGQAKKETQQGQP